MVACAVMKTTPEVKAEILMMAAKKKIDEVIQLLISVIFHSSRAASMRSESITSQNAAPRVSLYVVMIAD